MIEVRDNGVGLSRMPAPACRAASASRTPALDSRPVRQRAAAGLRGRTRRLACQMLIHRFDRAARPGPLAASGAGVIEAREARTRSWWPTTSRWRGRRLRMPAHLRAVARSDRRVSERDRGDRRDSSARARSGLPRHPDSGRHRLRVIEAIGSGRMPPVVFVTRLRQYALRAFDVRALDYLLKPFRRERFRRPSARPAARPERAPGELERRAAGTVRT